MGWWDRTEKAPEYDGVDIDGVILDTYINKHKSPKLDLDYIDKVSKELNIAPYDIGRVLGYAPQGLSIHIPNPPKIDIHKNIDFTEDWIDQPMSQEDFDLFRWFQEVEHQRKIMMTHGINSVRLGSICLKTVKDYIMA